MKLILIQFLLIFCTTVFAEKIQYEIVEIASGKLIAKGVKEYTVNDLILNPYTQRGERIIEKLIELKDGFKVGARIFNEPKLTGFGLIVELEAGDFSWEWYNLKENTIFKKLQGKKGFVKVRVSGLPMTETLEEVLFLDDAHLSFRHGGTGKAKSHTIIIKKGSVLKFD